jgi:hypothetical protein
LPTSFSHATSSIRQRKGPPPELKAHQPNDRYPRYGPCMLSGMPDPAHLPALASSRPEVAKQPGPPSGTAPNGATWIFTASWRTKLATPPFGWHNQPADALPIPFMRPHV